MSAPRDSIPDPDKDTVRQSTDETIPLPETPSNDLLSQGASNALDLGTAQAIAGERYRLENLAGSGGMGFVFVAHDERLERKVAIKFLKDVEASSNRESLLKEARAMAGLRHPGICPVYEVNTDATRPFIVMGWIDGLELDRAWWNMDLQQRVELIEHIVDATAALHDAGLVHLDIKPLNILVDRTGNPVIVDFGLARTSTHGSTGSSGGTPGFAAPEQFGSGNESSAACDVYALGMILYFGLTDRLPWSETDPHAIIERARSEEAPPPGEFIPDIPWPLQRITLAAIERTASNRYPDAKSLLRDIQRYRRGESVSARPSSLLNSFQLQVQQRRDETEAWHTRGMITRHEADQLARVYDRVQQPYSHWIVDSRRLSVSQVSLYSGAWLVLMAITIGIGFSWEALDDASWLRYGIPLFFTSALALVGVKLIHSDRKRMALGYLFTACLAVPISVGIFLVEQEWLNDASHGQLLSIALHLPPVLSNMQLLACSATLIAVSILAHRRIPSSAFSPMIVLGTILLCLSGWAALGMMNDSGGSFALLGAWSLFLGVVYLAIGIPASLREQRQQVLLAPGTGRVHIAWALLSGGSILVVLGLTLLAWYRPWLYVPGLLPAPGAEALQDAFPSVDDRSRAAAFMVNGLVLLGMSAILTWIGTNPCRRLAELIRWLIPAHILGGMLALEQETWHAARNADLAPVGCWIWLSMTAVSSAAFAFSSVLRQWRPFLVSGLLGIAAAYWTLYERLEQSLAPATFEWAAIGLVAATCIGGMLIMVISGRLASRKADPA